MDLLGGYGWIWMKPPNTRMDMDRWSSILFGYGWIWICLLYGLDWMDIRTYIRKHACFSVYSCKAKDTEDAFKAQCLLLDRNLFPPLGNLTPQDTESELTLQLSPVPLPTAWARMQGRRMRGWGGGQEW